MLNVFDRFTGAGDRNWSAELLKLYGDLQHEADQRRKAEEAKRVAGTSPSLALVRYVGTYSDPLFGEVVVGIDSGKLRVRYGTAYSGPLEHWHYDTFRAAWDAAWRGTALVTFVLDANGRPATLRAFGGSFRRPAEQ
jgi:hypothetical protein